MFRQFNSFWRMWVALKRAFGLVWLVLSRTFRLTDQQEELLTSWMRDNPSLWDQKNIQYKNKQQRQSLWEAQAARMGLTLTHIQTAYRDLRDWHTKLHKPPKLARPPER